MNLILNIKNITRLASFSLLSFFILISCNEDDTQSVVNNFDRLVFADEFDIDGAPDPTVWSYDIGQGENGWGNNELQYYTSRTENIKVENGYLLITARQESYGGANYTSARLNTQDKLEQAYGRFEARIRVPSGKGYWPAFWMLGSNFDDVGWPQCGEIDIMENRGSEPTIVAGSVHGPGYSAGEAITKNYNLENTRVDSEFHVYGIEWTEDFINYYVDDVLYNQITREDVEEEGEWVFNQPFFLLLNLAVGGNYDGSPNEATQFPQTMLVDYVRIYQ